MKSNSWRPTVVLALATTLASCVWAQNNVAADHETPPVSGNSSSAANGTGPVRIARVSFLNGDVTWRTDSSSDWSDATVNLPIREGAQISVPNDGRAEVQFDDGSLLRIAAGSVVTLQSLYSDSQGEFTELALQSGTATMHLMNQYGVFQIDTPDGSVKASGPARIRVDDTEDLKVGVQEGKATVTNSSGENTLHVGDFGELASAGASAKVMDLPEQDAWDQFCDSRDQLVAQSDPDLPSDINLVAGDLNSYGSWSSDPDYGRVWYPAPTYAGWRPYHDGRWVWVSPFGWTWVGSEPWGWAPYHYGTWVYRRRGWCWVPGPATQYWCPAVVTFSEYNGNVAWVPLCPEEVQFPATFTCGFGQGNWAVYFSIGSVAMYAPANGRYCVARPWDNRWVNRTVNVRQTINVTKVYNTTVITHGFIPQNARHDGGTMAPPNSFGGKGTYRPLGPNGVGYFQHGSVFAPTAGRPFTASVRPTISSVTPGRSFAANGPSHQILQRPVVRTTTAQNPTPRVTNSSGAAYARPRTTSTGSVSANSTRVAWSPNSRMSGAEAAAAARRSIGYSRTSTDGTRGGTVNSDLERNNSDRSNRGSGSFSRGGSVNPDSERTSADRSNGSSGDRYNRGSGNSGSRSGSRGGQSSTSTGSWSHSSGSRSNSDRSSDRRGNGDSNSHSSSDSKKSHDHR
jgi:hypothetical protein